MTISPASRLLKARWNFAPRKHETVISHQRMSFLLERSQGLPHFLVQSSPPHSLFIYPNLSSTPTIPPSWKRERSSRRCRGELKRVTTVENKPCAFNNARVVLKLLPIYCEHGSYYLSSLSSCINSTVSSLLQTTSHPPNDLDAAIFNVTKAEGEVKRIHREIMGMRSLSPHGSSSLADLMNGTSYDLSSYDPVEDAKASRCLLLKYDKLETAKMEYNRSLDHLRGIELADEEMSEKLHDLVKKNKERRSCTSQRSSSTTLMRRQLKRKLDDRDFSYSPILLSKVKESNGRMSGDVNIEAVVKMMKDIAVMKREKPATTPRDKLRSTVLLRLIQSS